MADKIIDPAPVIKRLANRCLAVKGMECTILGEVIDMLRAEPTVDAVEVVHGRWESTRFGDIRIATCSACGAKQGLYINGRVPNLNYCPNCGAKMDGGNEDDTKRICKHA